MVGECYNDMRCCDYPVSRFVCSCVFDELIIWQRAVLTHFRFLCRLLCDISDSLGTITWNPGYIVWVPSFDWVSYVDVYVVSVCGHSYDLRICVRVVVVTRVCFG